MGFELFDKGTVDVDFPTEHDVDTEVPVGDVMFTGDTSHIYEKEHSILTSPNTRRLPLTHEPDELTVESVLDRARAHEAFKEAANNSKHSNSIGKVDDSYLARAQEERFDKQDQLKLQKAENRKEAAKELGDQLVSIAKATGKGVKEVARLAYNLSLGKNVSTDNFLTVQGLKNSFKKG